MTARQRDAQQPLKFELNRRSLQSIMHLSRKGAFRARYYGLQAEVPVRAKVSAIASCWWGEGAVRGDGFFMYTPT